MKESTGGALLMGLAAGIIIIFIIMVAFFISYGQSFRLKNEIINQIEQKEGMTETEIKDFIAKRETKYNGKSPTLCVNIIGDSPDNFKGFTIEVTVRMQMDRNILGRFNVDIPIRGETRIIEKGKWYKLYKEHNESSFLSGLRLSKCP